MKKVSLFFTAVLLYVTVFLSINIHAAESIAKTPFDFSNIVSYIRHCIESLDIANLTESTVIDEETDFISQGAVFTSVTAERTVDPSKPMIAVTFDDGPSIYTSQLLDCLDRNGVKATFFIAGNRLDSYRDIVLRIRNEGHEIGSHGWSHQSLSILGYDGIVSELTTTQSKIYEISGINCNIARPPYGDCNSLVRQAGKDLGIHYFNWSVDTLDWKLKDASKVHDAVVNGAYDGAIILCHDIHKTTVDAMETAIPKLIQDGYQLVTVSELMAFSNIRITPGGLYFQR